MCLSVPAQVISIEDDTAKVSVGGTIMDANLNLVEDIKIGDYILLHTGFALQKIDEKEALETLKIFGEFDELNVELDREEEETGKRIT
jgi:hydrogenase expression/formation protein HypC